MTRQASPELPLTELLHLETMHDISLVDIDKAEERDPLGVTLAVKATEWAVEDTETPAEPDPVGEGPVEAAPTVPEELEPTDDPREKMRGPEGGDVAVPSGRTEPRSGIQKADITAGGAVEEDDMGFSLDDLKAAMAEANAPLMQRIEAIETAQKAMPVVGTISGEPMVTLSAPVQPRPLDADAVRDAIAVYEARKAGGFAEARTSGGAGFPLLNGNGREELRAISKATPHHLRPDVTTALRILTQRDIYSGDLMEVQ